MNKSVLDGGWKWNEFRLQSSEWALGIGHLNQGPEMRMAKPTRSFTEADTAIVCRSMFSSLKLNLSISGSKSKNAHFHNHSVASMRLADVSQNEL
jgi:hypothetical protein